MKNLNEIKNNKMTKKSKERSLILYYRKQFYVFMLWIKC